MFGRSTRNQLKPHYDAPVFEMENVTGTYPLGKVALSNVSLSVDSGEFVAITGPSGSGKSTLIRVATNVLKPQSRDFNYTGDVRVLGNSIPGSSQEQVDALYRRHVGIGFQLPELDPELTVGQGIMSMLGILSLDADTNYINSVAKAIGAADIIQKRGDQLSGGQTGRADLLMAFAKKDKLIILDEPTSALDIASTNQVLGAVKDIAADLNSTVLMVAHDAEVLDFATGVIEIRDGVAAQHAA